MICDAVTTADSALLRKMRGKRNVFFFFQAEDGIRVADVTGVQTCALPISCSSSATVLRWTWESMKPGRSVPCCPSTALSAVVAAEITPLSITTVRSSVKALPSNTLTLVIAIASDMLCFPSLFKQFRDMSDGLLNMVTHRV